jgi:hypothetical protein
MAGRVCVNEEFPAVMDSIPGASGFERVKYDMVCEGVSGGEYVVLLDSATVYQVVSVLIVRTVNRTDGVVEHN